MFLAKASTSSVTPTASAASSDPSWRKFEAILVISETVLLLDSLEIPVLNLPLISAKSLRIPEIMSSSALSSDCCLVSGRSESWGEEGGGARKEATPQSWRVTVLVSSERSSLTPCGDGVGDDDGESEFGFGGDFGSVALALGLLSSSSSSSLSEFAIDLTSHDIVWYTVCSVSRRLRGIKGCRHDTVY